MNKKALAPITIVLVLLLVLIVWAYFTGPLLTTWGGVAASTAGLTGEEQFFWKYANFFFLFAIAIAIFYWRSA